MFHPSSKPWNQSPTPFPNCAFCWQPRVGFFCPVHGCISHGHEQIHGSPPGIGRAEKRTEGQSALSTQLPGTQVFRRCLGNRSCSQPCWVCPRQYIWAPAIRCRRQGVHVLARVHGCQICTGRQARHLCPQWTSLEWASQSCGPSKPSTCHLTLH